MINPGSAGDARDSRNDRQLSCAVLDVVSEEVRVIDYPRSAIRGYRERGLAVMKLLLKERAR